VSEISQLIRENYRAAERLVDQLRRRGWQIATAESVTGGYLAAFITSVPQASQCYRGSLIVYDVDSKHELLGLDREILVRTEGVGPGVTRLLAERTREKFSSQICLATTGYAGPSGRQIGLIYLAVALPGEVRLYQWHIETQQSPYSREEIRLKASWQALTSTLQIMTETA